ncbi:hypothetical protein WJX74_003019 [Apatococcus lobatus]|uniref:Nascent polypeptide-associated complex subunit alpha-like UBA domain-containing protein n=1 Tax=Apatococcus lobatus TaxID=904363 RepID=A0AAW1S386_9CHLO
MSEETGATLEEKKTREGAEQAQALDRVTDHVEEKELDSKKVHKAMQNIAAAQQANKEAQRVRDRQLAAVKIKASDVSIIAEQFEVDSKTAERRLREHDGNVKQALTAMLCVGYH